MNRNECFVLIDQAAGQKQIAILDAFQERYKNQVIISGNINERGKKLRKEVIWEKTIRYNRKNTLTRLFTWLIFTIQTYLKIKRRYKNSELFIITNPPTTIFLHLFLRNKFRVLIFDLYPDAFYEYGYLGKNSYIYKKWAGLNTRIFYRAERIYTLSQGMADSLSQYVDYNKIEIVDLWTDSSFLTDVKIKHNWFAEKLNIQDKFVIIYSGNMGITHPVEIILQIAEKIKQYVEIVFLLIGGGHKYASLKEEIERKGLENVKIMPWLKAEELPYSFNSAKIGMVTLDEVASRLSVPSKVFDLFAVGLPVVGIGSPHSELSQLLKKYNSGVCFERNDIEGMVNFILKLKNDPEFYSQINKNSKVAATYHTPKNALKFL